MRFKCDDVCVVSRVGGSKHAKLRGGIVGGVTRQMNKYAFQISHHFISQVSHAEINNIPKLQTSCGCPKSQLTGHGLDG